LLPFAALVPLRVYPNESVPFKDLCMAGTGCGKGGIPERAGKRRPQGYRGDEPLRSFT